MENVETLNMKSNTIVPAVLSIQRISSRSPRATKRKKCIFSTNISVHANSFIYFERKSLFILFDIYFHLFIFFARCFSLLFKLRKHALEELTIYRERSISISYQQLLVNFCSVFFFFISVWRWKHLFYCNIIVVFLVSGVSCTKIQHPHLKAVT